MSIPSAGSPRGPLVTPRESHQVSPLQERSPERWVRIAAVVLHQNLKAPAVLVLLALDIPR